MTSCATLVSLLALVEVVIKNDVVVILLHIIPKTIMLGQEAFKHVRWSVISKLSGMHVLSFKHKLKETFSMTSSLSTFMDVEV